MTLNEVYLHIYDLVSLIFTEENIMAQIFQSDTSTDYPNTLDPFIVIGYTPSTLIKLGNSTAEDIIDPGNGDPSYILRHTPYSAEVEIRQVNGDGNLLKIILSSLETQYMIDFLSSIGFSINDTNVSILSIPFRIDQKVHKESIVSPVFSRSEEHTSELQSHSFISYAVFCLKKKK